MAMWERRLLSAAIAVPLTLALALLDVQEAVAFVGLGAIVFVSMLVGFLVEPWLEDRRRTQA